MTVTETLESRENRDSSGQLSPEHRAYLNRAAIRDEVLDTAGVCTAGPGIAFPYRWYGTEVVNYRPDVPKKDSGGRPIKYVWPSGTEAVLTMVSDPHPASPVLLVEGTKQALAVASWAPDGYAVAGMNGCWGWTKTDLMPLEDRKVYIVLDADAAANLDVYTAGTQLAEQLSLRGCDPKFVRLPCQGKDGADDWLASLPQDRRTEYLARLVEKSRSKPADKRPSRKAKKDADLPVPDGGRAGVVVNGVAHVVTDRFRSVLLERASGRTLFNFGGILTQLDGAETRALDEDRFLNLLIEHLQFYQYNKATATKDAGYTSEGVWPHPNTVKTLRGCPEAFATLEKVSRTPFLRADGTVCDKDGYDPDSRIALCRDAGMDRVRVPDAPSRQEAQDAARFLLDEWLGDIRFRDQADRANALATVLTPFVRGFLPLSPLTVVSGTQPGVGKNLFADLLSILATGESVKPLAWHPDNDEELRKQITSTLALARELMVFDEAHDIKSAILAQVLTESTHTDRLLGTSKMAEYPQRATWLALGNNVQIGGDMGRRICMVRLHPRGANPQDRDIRTFRHPDIRQWTRDNRPELVSAVLVLLRSWYAAGKPAAYRGVTLASFEAWDTLMSGVLAWAGVEGFLANTEVVRAETDYAARYWKAHLTWLHDMFGTAEFTTRQVRSKAMADPASYEAPPELDDPSGSGYVRQLGQKYGRAQDRFYGDLCLVKSGTTRTHTTMWTVRDGAVQDGDGGPGEGGPDGSGGPDGPGEGGPGGHLSVVPGLDGGGHLSVVTDTVGDETPAPSRAGEAVEESVRGTEAGPVGDGVSALSSPGTVGFDLEGHSADALYRLPRDGSYVRLGGLVADDLAAVTESPRILVRELSQADEVFGHNILGFDIPALAVHHGADYDVLASRAFDTMTAEKLLDPPVKGREKRGYYGLDQVAQRYGYEGKTGDLKGIARKYAPEKVSGLGEKELAVLGLDAAEPDRKLTPTEQAAAGYGLIDPQDTDYREYLEGDLRANDRVYRRQVELLEERGLTAYARREMTVTGLQNRMTVNGWRIDRELLAERVAQEEDRRQESLKWLADNAGLPLTREVSRGRGSSRETVFEPVLSPVGTKAGKQALIEAFREAGAPYYPKTACGDLATSSDALGEGMYPVGKGRDMQMLPGMLNPRAYGSNPAVRAICEHIATVTGVSAKYAEISRFVTPWGRVHGRIGETQTSGRWAMVMPSVTNLGKRGGKVLQRAVFVSDEGRVLRAFDFAQVDMRALAALSGDEAYAELFVPGRDAHQEIADLVGVTREEAKPIGHGWNYGRGNRAISESTGIAREVVEQFDAGMRERFPRLVQWKSEVTAIGESGELLDNGWGRPVRVDPQRAYTQAPALAGQGCARDIMCEGLLRMDQTIPGVRGMFRGVVHDEVVLDIPTDRLDEVTEAVIEAMTFEFRGIPILADASKPGMNWADCYAK